MGWLSRTAQSIRSRAKKTTRSAFRHLEPVRAYVTGGLVYAATYINPALGLGVAGLRGVEARYIGATVARDEGLSGHAAKQAGRRQREKELKAAGIGGAAGALTAIAVGSPWTGSGLFGATNPNAAAEATMAAYDAAGGPAAHGVVEVAPSAIDFTTGAGSRLPLVSSAGEDAFNVAAQRTMEAYDLAGGPAAHGITPPATGAGGGFFQGLGSTLTDTAKTLLPAAQTFLAGKIPPNMPEPFVDLAGAVLGGAGGGSSSDPESVSDAFSPREWSTGAKLAAGAVGAVAAGFFLYTFKKKAA